MKTLKTNKILTNFLLLVIISTNFFYFLKVETPIGSDNQNDNKTNHLVALKSSGYAITEKWNYTGSNIDDIEISADGNYVAALQNIGDNLTLFHKNSNKTLWNTDISTSLVYSFDISADGRFISVGSEDSRVYLLNNTEATPAWSKTVMWNASLGDYLDVRVAISGDGKYTVAVRGVWLFLLDNTLKSSKWSYSTGGTEIRAVDIGYNPIEGRYYIAIGDQAGNVTLFEDTSNIPLWRNDTTSSIGNLKISDDGSYILARNSDYEVYLFDNTVQTPKLALWNYTTLNMVDIDISADGKHMIVRKESRIHYLNNSASDIKQPVWDVKATDNMIYDGGISGDGKYILVGGFTGGTGFTKLYNSTKLLPKVDDWEETKGSNVYDVAINGFGNYFAVVEDSNILHFYHHDVPLPSAIAARSGGGGGSGDDDDEAVIPFGNYYLVFACIAIISLAVIMRRKVSFKTK